MTVLERLGIATPVVQAGMGGGLSRHELAAAVSEAGGLGTIAVNGAAAIERQLAAARKLTAAPIAVNLLLPFARRGWFAAAARADAVVTFWGAPRRRTPGIWIHQCGSVAEARAAHAAGADAVIVQGVEAGGHVRGAMPALELHERVRAALPADYPTLLAGGIAERADVQRALEAGACRRSRRHALPAQRREPRPPRLQAAWAGGIGDDPDRALRLRLAGAAPGRAERRHRALARRRPARPAPAPRPQPPLRSDGPLRARRGPGAPRSRSAARQPPAHATRCHR